MPAFNRNKIIGNIVLIAFGFLFLSVCLYRHSDSMSGVIVSDTKGYYMYLPAVFVYKNIHSLPDIDFIGRNKNEKGEGYTKYTCGIAFFYLPFFLAAHLYAHLFHLDASGFSEPYSYALLFCGVFWAFVGLFLLKKLLLRYFTLGVTWITLLSIMLGTNFFNYASFEVGMSHVYNFTLFAAIILATDQYYRTPKKSLAILIGVLAAWIILARPTNMAMLIFLFLYRVVTFQDLKGRILFFRRHLAHVFLAIPFFIAVMIPQMAYWKEMTGHWITYSYEREGFIYWARPKILDVLFDPENGLFIYAPALLFMIWALIVKRKEPRTNFWGISIAFAIITYLFASWWAWLFGAAFGHRCYIDYFPAFAFPIAVTIEKITGLQNKLVKYLLFFLIVLSCYYTVALSELYMYKGRILGGDDWQWNWYKWIGLMKEIF